MSAAQKKEIAVTYQCERFDDVIDEVTPHLLRHWDELARNKDEIPLEPDYDAYSALDKAGRLLICTCRDGGKIAGYACYFILPRHPHYNAPWAIADIFWLAPEYRRLHIGTGIFQSLEQALRARGVLVMHTTFKVEHPAAGYLLQSMGHVLIEHGYAKFLGN
jgi:GNAT superfamily N-acetyltransferase